MTNQIQVFQNTDFGQLEVVEIDGKPYFPATRCAKILGYSNPHDAISKHCLNLAKHEVENSRGQVINGNLIPEGDLYRLIVRSKLPTAEKFERWVFDEVLPSIRKHGMYAADELLANPDLFIKALESLKAEREKNLLLTSCVVSQKQEIEVLKPKADYYDIVLNCKDAVPITIIAKDYGFSGQAMNAYLHNIGIQFKQGDIWLLYQQYTPYGYTCTKTFAYYDSECEQRSKIHTFWTQAGRLFLYGELKKFGVLPLIERTSE